MTRSKLIGASALVALAIATPSLAGQRGQGRSAGASQGSAGRAVPRGPVQGAPPVARPGPGAPGAPGRVYGAPGRVYGAQGRPYGYPGRPYGYAYRPYYGYPYRPYGYYPRYYYGYPYYYGNPGLSFYFGLGYPLGFSASFGYPYPAYGYPYGYAYPPYGYANPPAGYNYPATATSGVGVAVGQSSGSSIRLDVDQRDAEVYVDGDYVGVVDDFNGSQRLELTSERHRIEIRREGFEPVAFDVNVEPGRTVTYRSRLRPVTP
jgi:PEGA domain